MRSPSALLQAVLLLAALLPAARAEQRIVWAMVDGPPFHLGRASQVEALGEGTTDRLIAQLAELMPAYRHELQWMSRQALWKRMQEGVPLCYADAFVTEERLRWAWMSEATPGMPLALVTRPGVISTQQGTAVSLKALLAQPGLRGAFDAQRSYGAPLDALIASARPAPQRTPLPVEPALLRMLELGRMDYFLEYPAAVQHHLEQMHQRPALEVHSIAEDTSAPPAAVACTRNAWGRGAIESVDAALRQIAKQSQRGALLLRWVPPSFAASERPRIERFYKERALRSDIR